MTDQFPPEPDKIRRSGSSWTRHDLAGLAYNLLMARLNIVEHLHIDWKHSGVDKNRVKIQFKNLETGEVQAFRFEVSIIKETIEGTD